MLARIISTSIQHRAAVIVLVVMILLYGLVVIPDIGLDIFPEFAPKSVFIHIEAPGLPPEQVEQQITWPIEQALRGIINLENIRSESIQGLAVIQLFFAESTDIFLNRQLVAERLRNVESQLPKVAKPANILPLASSSATIMTIGLTSPNKDLFALRRIAELIVARRLLSVPGVADVNVFGGFREQLQIQADPKLIARAGIDIQELSAAINQALIPQGTGFIEGTNQQLTVNSPLISAETLGSIILKVQNEQRLLLRDLATIQVGPEPPLSAASINGNSGIIIMIIGQYGANTHKTTQSLEIVLKELQTKLSDQGITLHDHLFRPADYIEQSVKNLTGHLFLSGILVVIVLYFSLNNFRTALICIVAIPLSLFSAIILLVNFGHHLNIIILSGLGIALGEVVDDAIIDTENILRRLRENRLSDTPKSRFEVIFNASLEVRGSVVYASFIVALVFVPLLTLGGISGRLFSPLGYAYIIAILMSLCVALTVTPALCYWFLDQENSVTVTPPLTGWLKHQYINLLRVLCCYPRSSIYFCLSLCVLSFAILPRLGGSLLPPLREGHYMIHTRLIPGTSLHESIRVGNLMTQQLLKIPGIRSVSQWAGRAERGADTYGSHYSEFEVDLHPLSGDQQAQVLRQIRAVIQRFPGVQSEVNTFLVERVDETLSGSTSPIVVNLYGDNWLDLDRTAQTVAKIIRSMPLATDVQVRSVPIIPRLEILPSPLQLKFWGVNPNHINTLLAIATSGEVLGKYYESTMVKDIVLTFPQVYRIEPLALVQLPIKSLEGKQLQLKDVVEVRQGMGRYNILHEQGKRIQRITCNLKGENITAFLDELKVRVQEKVKFPLNIYPEYSGAAIEQQKTFRQMLIHAFFATIGVLLLIHIAINNFRHLLIMLANLPFALTGGILAMLITSTILSVGALIGFVTLFGITIRNSIMLISHYHRLVEIEQQSWGKDTMIVGAIQRLPSILMTALVTILAIVPLAINSDNPGREIMGPMSVVIIGGLISSTLLNLLILPVLMLSYARFSSFAKQ